MIVGGVDPWTAEIILFTDPYPAWQGKKNECMGDASWSHNNGPVDSSYELLGYEGQTLP